MNKTTKNLMFAVSIASGLGLTSCVVPNEGTATTSTSVTTYSPGYTVSTLPSGYRTETIRGTSYYYYNGAYYQRRSNEYVVVEPPRSSRYYDEYTRYTRTNYDGSTSVITELPNGYTTVEHQGTPYYRYQDRYYRRQGSGYVVVASPF